MRLILPLISIVLLSSCTRYQYLTVSSDNLPLNDKKEFVAENDTIKVIYSFNGDGGPVQIAIHNKSDQGIYIDWKRSALIAGDKPFALLDPRTKISGSVENLRWSTSNSVEAVAVKPDQMEFIPPRSTISRADFFMVRTGLIDKSMEEVQEERTREDGLRKTIRESEFTNASSPLPFRSYLSFVIGDMHPTSFSLEHTFYISHFLETDTPPAFTTDEDKLPKNEFYMKKKKKNGSSSVGVAAVIGLSALIAAEAIR